MNMGQQLLYFFTGLGAFNGMVLSGYLLLQKKVLSMSAIFLGILLFVLSVHVGKLLLFYFDQSLMGSDMCLQIGLSTCFLIGPAVYYFIKAGQMKLTTIPTSWKWVGAIHVLVLIIALMIPYQTANSPVWNKVITTIIYGQWAGWLVAAIWLLRPAIRKALTNRSALTSTEKFQLLIAGGNFFVFTCYFLSMLGVQTRVCAIGAVFFSSFVYFTVFFCLSRARMTSILQGEDTALGKPAKRKIAGTEALAWKEKLDVAALGDQLYKDPNLKLSDLALRINMPAHQLSQLLNDNMGKSFSTYINEIRIREACRMIVTDDRLTFEAIGYEVGYNSKSTFYTAFKKITATTPALYKEKLVAG